MVQTAALLKPSQKVLDAIKDYTVKIDSETISDLPLKATLIYESLQKYNVSPAILADVLGKSPEIINVYLNQRIDPNLMMDFHGVPYREIDRAKVERQIRAEKQALGIKFSGGMSDDFYTHDMAQKLAIRGITDLQDFAAHHNEMVLPIGTGVRANQYEDGTVKYLFAVINGENIDEYPIEESKLKIKDSIDPEGNTVKQYVITEPITLDLGIDYFFNKNNGKKFDQSGNDVWESAYEGKGGVYYKVKFTNTGLPVFYTQHFETGFKAEIAPFLPIIAIVGAAVGLPLLVGESILGAVGITVENSLISTTIGNVAVNSVLTGGDVGAALAKAAAGAAGGYVGDFAGTGVDSIEIGKIAGAAATAAIQGKDPKNAAALSALTLGISMGEYDGEGDQTIVDDTITLDDIGVDITELDLDAIFLENRLQLRALDLDIDSELPDSAGNVFNGVGEAVEYDLKNYWDGIGVNAETADVVDPYNRILIPGDQAVKMTEAEIQAELDRAYKESQGQTVESGKTYSTRKADLPPPAAQVKVPGLLDQTTYADKLLKAAVSIGASVKAIANGTFRPAYTMSPYGTARVQSVGVPITQPDGSVIVNNGNGTQTIRYPNGQSKTVATTYSSTGMFGGISSTTLLIGGGVLLAALLLSRRK